MPAHSSATGMNAVLAMATYECDTDDAACDSDAHADRIRKPLDGNAAFEHRNQFSEDRAMIGNRCEQQNNSTDAILQDDRSGLTLAEIIVVVAILTILGLLLLPNVRRSGEATRRSQCKNNLKQIVIALYNYHDMHGALPPACTVDASGQPLHSWRTLILPFLDQEQLYDNIDLSKPWNDPANAEAYSARLAIYACPSAEIPDSHTTCLALVGPDCAFQSGQPKRFRDIKDGTSNTLLVVEVADADAVHWMAPTDSANEFFLSFTDDTELSHAGGIHVAFADGAVRFLSAELTIKTRRALTTIAGGEDLTEDF